MEQNIVPNYQYLNRDKNIISHLPKAIYIKCNVNNELGIVTQAANVYEFLNHNTTTGIYPTESDYILPEKGEKGWYNFQFDQEHYTFKSSMFSDSIKI